MSAADLLTFRISNSIIKQDFETASVRCAMSRFLLGLSAMFACGFGAPGGTRRV